MNNKTYLFSLTAFVMLYSNLWSQNWQYVSPQLPSGNGAQLSFDTAGFIYVKYVDDVTGQFAIKKMSNNSWVNVGAVKKYVTPDFPYCGALSACGCPPLCACGWSGGAKWFDGNDWTWVGGDSLVLQPPGLWGTGVKVDNNGTPYLFAGKNTGVYVYKFNGTSWSSVGASPFAYAYNASMTFDKNNVPYVALEGSNGSLSIMKFDGNSWVYLGNPNFVNGGFHSPGLANPGPLLIDKNGIIYIAFSSPFNSGGRVSVMSFDGVSYNYVGGQNISTLRATSAELAIDSNNVLFLTYSESYGGISVQKFTNGNWVYVGAPRFQNHSEPLSIMFDKHNYPHIAHGSDYLGRGYIRRFDSLEYFNIISYQPDTVCEGNLVTLLCRSNIHFDSLNDFKLYIDPCISQQNCYTGYTNLLSDSAYSQQVVGDTFTISFQIPHRTLDDTVNGNTAQLPLSIFSSSPYAQSETSSGFIEVVKGPDFNSLPTTLTICQDSLLTLSAGLATGQSYEWTFSLGDSLVSTSHNLYFSPWISGSLILASTFLATGCVNYDTAQVVVVTNCVTNINLIDSDDLLLYPNPASNCLIVQTNSMTVTEINIYNSTGVLVSQSIQQPNSIIDISKLTNGIYIAEIKSKDVSIRKKWTKM